MLLEIAQGEVHPCFSIALTEPHPVHIRNISSPISPKYVILPLIFVFEKCIYLLVITWKI